MPLKFDSGVRNAMLDAIETNIGTAPTLKIFTGSAPANCAAADSGTVLATLTLPSDWLAAASSGSKAKSGTWTDSSADASGTAGHFRIYAGATCKMQGTVSGTGGGGDMTMSSTTLTSGFSFTINNFTLNAGNS
jgi:hypothetical protein